MRRSLLSSIVGVGLAFFFLIGHPAQAADINVACSTAALIAAVTTANGTPAADTLNLAAGCPYVFTTGDATNADSALPRIATPITINGNGAFLIRSGGLDFRLLYIDVGGNLTLDSIFVIGGSLSTSGGGIYNGSGTLTVTNSTVSGNTSSDQGGGIYNDATLTVTNSTLSGNSAVLGGGIRNNGGTVMVTDSTLSGNTASDGGGIFSNGTLTVTNSTLSSNSASGLVGGIYSNGILEMTNSTLSGNSAGSQGGGIQNEGAATVTNSTISGNSATNAGGILNTGSSMTVTNSTISGNSANEGGGVYNTGATMTVTNSTISGNSAANAGGGIYTVAGTLTVTNSIVWDNNTQFAGGGSTTVSYSDIQGGFAGTGNLDVDPLFVSAVQHTSAPTTAGNYHLQANSPAIDVGSNAELPADTHDLDGDSNTAEPLPIDRDGDARVIIVTVDMGADEVDSCQPYASPYTVPAGNTAALITAIRCANVKDDANVINLTNSVYLFFTGDAVHSGSALPRITTPITINGSGAFLVRAGSPDFRLLFVGSSGNLTLNKTVVVGGNSSDGGGIYNDNGVLTVTGSTLSGNSASNGGGIFNDTGTVTLTNSTISGNSAASGGGIFNYDIATLTVTNSTLSGNSASNNGGGIYNDFGGMLIVTNSTLSGNSAGTNGGGIRNNAGGTTTVTSSIVWGNNTQIAGTATVTFSDVEGGFAGTGNLNADPLFVAAVSHTLAPTAAGDYHLQSTSPALNVGDNASLPADAQDLDGDANTTEPIPYDRDGNPRVVNTTVDMGAYEHQTVFLFPSELLDNGGFEIDADLNKIPDGWTVSNGSGDKLTCKPGKPHAGTCAFNFKGSASEKAQLSQIVDFSGLTLGAGDTLTLSAFFKGNDPTAKAKFTLSVTYTGNPTPVTSTVKVKRNAAYTQKMLPVMTLTSGALDQIKVTIKHQSKAGKLLIDDASLIHTPFGLLRNRGNGARRSDLLPPPLAPGGFRGGN